VRGTVGRVMSYVENLTTWNQKQASHIYATICVVCMFFVFMDFADEIAMETSVTAQRLSTAIKIIGALFIICATCLAVQQSRNKSELFQNVLGGKASEMQLQMAAFNKHTKYKMTAVLATPNIEKNNPIIEFSKMLVKNDLEYVQNTFASGELLCKIQNYTKEGNVVSYELGETLIRLTMIADDELARQFFIRQEICQKSREDGVPDRVVREKVFHLTMSRDTQQMQVTLFAVKCEEANQEIVEFTAIRNIWMKSGGHAISINTKHKRMKSAMDSLQAEVHDIKLSARKLVAEGINSGIMSVAGGDLMTDR